MERKVLDGIDPASVLDDSGTTAQQRLDQVRQRCKEITTLADTDLSMLKTLPPREVSAYFDRRKLYGEASALKWLRVKYPR